MVNWCLEEIIFFNSRMAFQFCIFISNGWTIPFLCILALSVALLLILFCFSKYRVETWWYLFHGYQHKASFYVFICLLSPHCIQGDASLYLCSLLYIVCFLFLFYFCSSVSIPIPLQAIHPNNFFQYLFIYLLFACF